jgi:hypothetical protein
MEEAMTAIERMKTAISLREPDRVPVAPELNYFNAYHADPRISLMDYLLDLEKGFKGMIQVWEKISKTDSLNPPGVALGHWSLLGPGGSYSRWFTDWRISDWNFTDQKGHIPRFVEKPIFDDYDELMEQGFAPLLFSPNIMNQTSVSNPIDETLKVMDKLSPEYGRLCKEHVTKYQTPIQVGSYASIPFDQISLLRGPQGTATDLHRRPEKIKELSEWMIEYELVVPKFISSMMKPSEIPGAERIFMMSSRASADFISPELWEEYVFPYVKRIIDSYVNDGYTPYLHWDGNFTPMLEGIKKLADGLPKGRIIAKFEKTDLAKAKEIIGDRICLFGNIASSTLIKGTPQNVKKECTTLIDQCAEGGGFIMATECETPWNAKLVNVKTMVEFTKEYGKYA